MSPRHTCGNEHSLDAARCGRYDSRMTHAAHAADPRYPVGKFARSASITPAVRHECIEELSRLPERIAAAVRGLTLDQLDTPYRAGGWTVRQVVHHVADSHMNAFIRMRLGATESHPSVKTYDEQAWSELADSRTAPIDLSLMLLDALHRRWVMWLRLLDEPLFARTVQHPEWGSISIDGLLELYAWHSRHHVAHITELRKRQQW
jgi:uncharacterized damage-inducible protein DinB